MVKTEATALSELIDRLGANDGLTIHISENELDQWPSKLIVALKEHGSLTKSQPSSCTVCPGCEAECTMPVNFLTHPIQIPQAFVFCDKRDDISRVPIAISYLEQWQTSGESIANLIAKLLGFCRPTYLVSEKPRWEIGLFKGTKHSSHLILLSESKLTLSLAGHFVPVSQALKFKKNILIIDRGLLNGLVDNPIAGAGDIESAQQRRVRLKARVEQLKNIGVKSFLKTVADEESISVSRLKQILEKK